MARTRSSTDNAGTDAPATTAAENQLLRQQLREMAGQLATLTEHVRLLTQPLATSVAGAQAPPAVPTAPISESPVADGEARAAPPPTAAVEVPLVHPTVPSIAPATATSGPAPGATVGGPQGVTMLTPTPTVAAIATGEASLLQSEQDRVRANLAEFKKYDPPVFEGEMTDPWVVEKWVDTMEKLFEDLLMEEYERVPLAVDFLEGNARMWWKTVRPDPLKGTALPSWSTFREQLFGAFFSNSVKRQMEDDLKNIKQGSRTVMEYQREFVRLVNCVPFVVRDESHKAQLFVDGLRNDIFQVVQAADLHTFQQVVDRATIVERGFAVTRARREGSNQHEDKKRSQPFSCGGGALPAGVDPLNGGDRSREPRVHQWEDRGRMTGPTSFAVGHIE